MPLISDNLFLVLSLLIFLSPRILRKHLPPQAIASTAVSLGILGTFLGIFLGLLNFDVNNISESIPPLLSGLRTAFATSIAGLVTSLIVKLRPETFGIKSLDAEDKKSTSAAAHMIQLLRNIDRGIASVEKSIAGDQETTLLTQVQKLRTTTLDGLGELNRTFKEFAERMVENNTQALIDALTQVMRDFNTKINEQFGENFKRLNEAVGKMVEWQKEYSARVEHMTAQFQHALQGISDCERTLESISQKTAVFQASSEKLDALLSNLGMGLSGVGEMGRTAQNAFPIIERQLKDLTQGFSEAVQSAVRENTRMLATQKEGIDQQIISMSRAYNDLGQHLQRISAETNANIDKLVKTNADRITEQLTRMDQELGNELNKALTTLGTQLTSLSAKFVQDYTPLTVELQKLVQLSNRN